MEEKYSPPEQFSRYVVIPSPVYFNAQIKPRAKLLYGLLSCMSNAKGYAYPKDSTLQRYLGGDGEPASLDTVKRLLDQLEKAGAIVVENGDGRSQKPRKIYMGDLDGFVFRKNAESIPQKCGMHIIKNKNNKNNNNKISDADIGGWINPWAVGLGYSMELTTPLISDFLAFADSRKAKGKPFLTIRAVSMQATKLVSLLPDSLKIPKDKRSKAKSKKMVPNPDKPEAIARMRFMLRSAISHNWEEVYGIDERAEREFWLWSGEELGILEPTVSGLHDVEYF